jgi:hypothetical protein
VEYATGTDPRVGNGSPVTVAAVAGVLNLTFNHIADPSLTYNIKASDDLVAFPVLMQYYTGYTTAGSETYEDSVPISSGPRHFLRLEVTTP